MIQFWGWSGRNPGIWITLKLALLSMGHNENRCCRYGAGTWRTTWRWIKAFLSHIELGQCRKCNYSLKCTQNFRLFNFVGQAVSENNIALAEVCGLWLLSSFRFFSPQPDTDTSLHCKVYCIACSASVHPSFHWYSLHPPMEGWPGWVDLVTFCEYGLRM